MESKGKIVASGEIHAWKGGRMSCFPAHRKPTQVDPRGIHEGALCPDDCQDVVGGGTKSLMLEILGDCLISEKGVIFQITFTFCMMSHGYD